MLVAGGGPAGLAAAAELASRGVPCVVIEPRAGVSHRRPRAKTTSVRTMEHLRRWGIADALRAAAPLPVSWSQRVTFCESLSGPRITDFDGAFGLVTGRDERFAESGQQVPQPVVEEVLRAHVRAQPGADLRLGHTVTGLAQRDDGVTVAVRDASGSGFRDQGRRRIGCDGAAGVVRPQSGPGTRGIRYPAQLQRGVPRPRTGHPSRPGRAVLGTRRGRAGVIGRRTCTGRGGPSCPGSTRRTARRAAGTDRRPGGPSGRASAGRRPTRGRPGCWSRTGSRPQGVPRRESARLNPPWGDTGSTPPSGTRSTWRGRSRPSSRAERSRDCWPARG